MSTASSATTDPYALATPDMVSSGDGLFMSTRDAGVCYSPGALQAETSALPL